MNEYERALELIFGELIQQAEQDFMESEEGGLLKQRREKLNEVCETNLTGDQWEFVQETFCELLQIEMRKREFTYQRGMRDCVLFLKRLGVLA